MINNAPYTYELFNKLNTKTIPSTIHIKDTRRYKYYCRYLFQEAMSVIENELPDWWDRDYVYTLLFGAGYMSVIDTEDYGVIPQQCTLNGYNIYYHPKYCLISSPILGSFTREIGKDCELIQLKPDYTGIMDLVQTYSGLLAMADESADINIFNSRLAYVFGANNKAMAETFKAMFDQIAAGEPAVAINEQAFDDQHSPIWTTFTNNLSGNFIAPAIVSLKKAIKAEFDTFIGIPNTNTDKKERLLVDEINGNNVDTMSKAALWIDTLNEGVDRCIELFPELKGKLTHFRFRVNPTDVNGNYIYGGELDATRNNTIVDDKLES